MPKINLIIDDLDLTAKVICFNAKSIQLGNYQKSGMSVLPQLEPGNASCVYFPDLNYSPDFWKLIAKQHDYSLTASWPESLLAETKNDLLGFNFPDTQKIVSEWGTRSSEFLSILSQYFSHLLPHISDIDILLTPYGTLSSFSKKVHPDGTFSLICSARIDFPLENIFNIITQALILCTQSEYADLGTIGWHQRGAIMSYLSSQTPLGKYISLPPSKPVPIINTDYLVKLGFPPVDSFTAAKLLLTPKEKRLFTCLQANKNVLVSFDDAATAVWQDQVDDKYSLYALAKLIEDLRRKIRSAGTNRDLIRTFRKQGYMLVS